MNTWQRLALRAATLRAHTWCEESTARTGRAGLSKLSPLFCHVTGDPQVFSGPSAWCLAAAVIGRVSSWTQRAADRRQHRAVRAPLGARALIVWEKKIVLAIMKDLFVNPVTLLQTGSLLTVCQLSAGSHLRRG